MQSKSDVNYAPIAIFTFNRPRHTECLIKSLVKCPEFQLSRVYVFTDGPRNSADLDSTNQVSVIIEQFKKCNANVIHIRRDKNIGLAKSVISGVSDVLLDNGRVIVLEDDLIVHRGFLTYMNQMLERLKNSEQVMSISGHALNIKFPEHYRNMVYLNPRSSSWGWGTWLVKWQLVDWQVTRFNELLISKESRQRFSLGGDDLYGMLEDRIKGRNSSWSIVFDFAHFENKMFCAYPQYTYIINQGFDGSGVHCGDFIPSIFNSNINHDKILDTNEQLTPCLDVVEKVRLALNCDVSPSLKFRFFRLRRFIISRLKNIKNMIYRCFRSIKRFLKLSY
jgi:hypothetical protein